MKKITRFVIQVILWCVFWFLLWTGKNDIIPFIKNHAIAYALQIVCIASIIYYLAPKLLYKKNYLTYLGVSILILSFATYLSGLNVNLPPVPNLRPGPPNGPLRNLPGPLQQGPSVHFLHFLMLAVAYSLATSIETFIYITAKEKQEIKLRNENLQTELKFLKSQINPHFLFNALNNIYTLASIQSSKTPESILDLSNMLRYVLYECEQPEVDLEKEVNYIKNYISLFSLKSSKPYAIDLKLKLDHKSHKIAPMLLVPFIENAFKHGNIEAKTGAYIDILIETKNQGINFTVKNTIPDLPKQKDEIGGIGLPNIKRRLHILYPAKHRLEILPTKETYEVKLNIRLDGKI